MFFNAAFRVGMAKDRLPTQSGMGSIHPRASAFICLRRWIQQWDGLPTCGIDMGSVDLMGYSVGYSGI